MKISVAQIRPYKGNIDSNIEKHIHWIHVAINGNADLIVFPELSLTSYEPSLAKELATTQDDPRLDVFQELSDQNNIAIAVGLPIKTDAGIFISMVVFQSDKTRKLYSKQILHEDEVPFFIEGKEQLMLSIKNNNVVPAICYEAFQTEHNEKAKKLGADIYLASVAKAQKGIDKANLHFAEIANKYAMTVLMSNAIGLCDNFQSAGQSAVWDSEGILKGRLDGGNEGLLIFDTETGELLAI